MYACFIGHRNIEKREEVTLLLKQTVLSLIDNGVTTFLFGSKSQFNTLAWDIVTGYREQYPFIRRVYVRSSNQYIDSPYEQFLLQFYEESFFLPQLEKAGKYSYVERNYAMIDNSDYCIFYYNQNYVPSVSNNNKNAVTVNRKATSGTKIAYRYAVSKGKTIINLYKET